MQKELSCMWVQGQLPRLAFLSLSSAVYFGYQPTIYLYDTSTSVPDGVRVADANHVIDQSQIFKRYGMFPSFADIFRYTLLSMKNAVWFDLDCVFVNEHLPLDDDYLFGVQSYNPGYRGNFPIAINNAVLTYPQTSHLAYAINAACTSFREEHAADMDFGLWEKTGPELLTTCVYAARLQDRVKPLEYFYPISWMETELFVEPEHFDHAMSRLETQSRKNQLAPLFHVWNSSLNKIYHKDKFAPFPNGSLLSYYETKFC